MTSAAPSGKMIACVSSADASASIGTTTANGSAHAVHSSDRGLAGSIDPAYPRQRQPDVGANSCVTMPAPRTNR